MAGLARLGIQLGHTISGCDKPLYPPMDKQLKELNIDVKVGFRKEDIPEQTDQIVIGNIMSRGNELIEYLLESEMELTSGPEWVRKHCLEGRKSIVVAGTHGKTTTSSLVNWILRQNNLKSGFLIGGITGNFGYSADLGKSDWFVIEGDEYDSAFFDKRSKFMHYSPEILAINNIEFDHADIFRNTDEIVDQFHYLIRTMPASSTIITPYVSTKIDSLLERGVWSRLKSVGKNTKADTYYNFLEKKNIIEIMDGENLIKSKAPLLGEHNAANLAMAISIAEVVGVEKADALGKCDKFKNVKRRLELVEKINNISLYDDFAHHPTAIAATINALKSDTNSKTRIVAIIEPKSNTMRSGVHQKELKKASANADIIAIYSQKSLKWEIHEETSEKYLGQFNDVKILVAKLLKIIKPGDKVLVMSNGSVGNFHQIFASSLREERTKL